MGKGEKLPVAIKAFLIVLGLVAVFVIGELVKGIIHEKPKSAAQEFEVGDEIVFVIRNFGRRMRGHSARIIEKEKARKKLFEPYFYPEQVITSYTILLDDGRKIKLELQHIKGGGKVTALLPGKM